MPSFLKTKLSADSIRSRDAHLEFVVMVVRDDLLIGTATAAPHGAFNTPSDPCANDMRRRKQMRWGSTEERK